MLLGLFLLQSGQRYPAAPRCSNSTLETACQTIVQLREVSWYPGRSFHTYDYRSLLPAAYDLYVLSHHQTRLFSLSYMCHNTLYTSTMHGCAGSKGKSAAHTHSMPAKFVGEVHVMHTLTSVSRCPHNQRAAGDDQYSHKFIAHFTSLQATLAKLWCNTSP